VHARRFAGAHAPSPFQCALALAVALELTACGGTSSSSTTPATAGPARVRFVDGAPSLETLVGSTPQDIGSNAFLQVNGQTVVTPFVYGTFTPFINVASGVKTLFARSPVGYAVGPITSASLSPGKRYTLIVVGSFPNYKVLTFEEPASASKAQLSFYEASPTVPNAAFGRFNVSTGSQFKQLGTASLGNVATVSLGSKVSNIGGYVGTTSAPIGTITPSQINPFNKHNALPFHNSSRLSLFLFDPKSGSAFGPVFGSLDP
jgi:hypothetical protein